MARRVQQLPNGVLTIPKALGLRKGEEVQGSPEGDRLVLKRLGQLKK